MCEAVSNRSGEVNAVDSDIDRVHQSNHRYSLRQSQVADCALSQYSEHGLEDIAARIELVEDDDGLLRLSRPACPVDIEVAGHAIVLGWQAHEVLAVAVGPNNGFEVVSPRFGESLPCGGFTQPYVAGEQWDCG